MRCQAEVLESKTEALGQVADGEADPALYLSPAGASSSPSASGASPAHMISPATASSHHVYKAPPLQPKEKAAKVRAAVCAAWDVWDRWNTVHLILLWQRRAKTGAKRQVLEGLSPPWEPRAPWSKPSDTLPPFNESSRRQASAAARTEGEDSLGPVTAPGSLIAGSSGQPEGPRALFDAMGPNADGSVSRADVIKALRSNDARELLGLPARLTEGSQEHAALERCSQHLAAASTSTMTWDEFQTSFHQLQAAVASAAAEPASDEGIGPRGKGDRGIDATLRLMGVDAPVLAAKGDRRLSHGSLASLEDYARIAQPVGHGTIQTPLDPSYLFQAGTPSPVGFCLYSRLPPL